MSGHSKWSTIKHKKAAIDSKKGKIFGEIARQIRVAVKEGKSGEAAFNPSLRLALEKAKSVNMPNSNIERAIEKGLGKSKDGKLIEEIMYEGYGPGGVGYLVLAVTDNRNRTGSEIRTAFDKKGGSLGGPGSCAFMFEFESGGEIKVKIPMPTNDEQIIKDNEQLVEDLSERDDVELVVNNLSL